jgi:sugar lactone lactonase YvrE
MTAVRAADPLGECPIWDPRQNCLWWVDIRGPVLQSYDPASGAHRRHRLPGTHVGSFALRERGGLVLAIDCGLVAFDPATGVCTPLLTVESGPPTLRLNDGRCDRRGRFWVGSMEIAERGVSAGALYRVDTDHRVTRQFGDVGIPNSTAFSPDDRTMYFADTPHKKIWAYDFDVAIGKISNRRIFVDMKDHPGYPDGSCVDAEGFLWNAEYAGGRVVRYAPDGRIDRVIEVPAKQTTCCAFGGPDLKTIYITSATQNMSAAQLAAEPEAGNLFAIETNVRGLPEAMFGG